MLAILIILYFGHCITHLFAIHVCVTFQGCYVKFICHEVITEVLIVYFLSILLTTIYTSTSLEWQILHISIFEDVVVIRSAKYEMHLLALSLSLGNNANEHWHFILHVLFMQALRLGGKLPKLTGINSNNIGYTLEYHS